MTEWLAEVPEAAATGRVAEVYADIRTVLGLPMVNLFYRHLATRPGVLEDCWASLRPNLASKVATSAAARLVELATPIGVAALPRTSLEVAGLTGSQVKLTRATLQAYRRANSLNLLGIFALLDGCPGARSPSARAAVPSAERILPMASPEDLTQPVEELLDEMSLQVVGDGEPRIVPSLLRHFAGHGCLLALLWTVLRPALPASAPRATGIARSARAAAHSLPHQVEAIECESARAVLVAFSDAIARTLLVGEMLSAALGEMA